jgi:titin
VDGSSPETPVVSLDGAVDVGITESCSVAGKPAAAGTVCRAAVDLCDVDEICNGVSTECPADKLAMAGSACRPAAGDCDIAETCDGASVVCPADGFLQLGTVCRPAVDLCDVAESCTGTSASCPIDSVAPASTVCRASTDSDKCDPAETCTGSDVSCPTNISYSKPGTPSNVLATAGALQATISWNAVSGATGYNVKRSTTSGTGYTTLVSSPTTNASPYVDTGLAGSTTYYYMVSAINTIATCQSENDSLETSVTTSGVCAPPAAPTITATPNDGIVTLSWAAATGAVSYSVARSLTTETGYVTIATVTTGTTFTDSNVTSGTTYYYVVTASNGTCNSGNSNEASTAPTCTPPAVPTGLTATAVNGSVILTWTASIGASSYSIYKNTTGSSTYTLVNSTAQVTFTDSSVVNDTKYYYVVTASNGSCSSANSMQVTVTPACVPPSAPTVTATPSNGKVTLSWTAPTGATSYVVYRGSTSGGESTTPIAMPTTTSYVDSNVSNNMTYYYVVAAANGTCSSGQSTEVSAMPVCTPPSVPGTLTATPGDAKVSLSWDPPTSWGSAGTDTYAISRKTGSGGIYTVIVAAQAGTSYTDSNGLLNGTTYYYKVSANNGTCSSDFNTEASATPVAVCSQGAPSDVAASITVSTQVNITWTASNPVPTGGYDIGRSTTSGTGYTNVGHVNNTTLNTTLTFTDSDTALLIGTTYFYEVTANGSCSASSTPDSIILTCQTPGVPSPSASNSAGKITIEWNSTTGATAYTVYRSTSATSGYAEISTNQTAAKYEDPASGLINGTTYYYKVSASNANHQCTSAQSGATLAVRSCTIPVAPAGLSATRSGNKQVTLVWTNSTGAALYNVLRSTTSGSGYTSIGTTSGTSYVDNTADNATAYDYVVTASSDSGGYCTSANSAEVSVPSCQVVTGSGTGNAQAQNSTANWCVVTCDKNIGWWSYANIGSRKVYINNVQQTQNGTIPLPAQSNSGYAFFFSAASDSNYPYINWGNGTGASCP